MKHVLLSALAIAVCTLFMAAGSAQADNHGHSIPICNPELDQPDCIVDETPSDGSIPGRDEIRLELADDAFYAGCFKLDGTVKRLRAHDCGWIDKPTDGSDLPAMFPPSRTIIAWPRPVSEPKKIKPTGWFPDTPCGARWCGEGLKATSWHHIQHGPGHEKSGDQASRSEPSRQDDRTEPQPTEPPARDDGGRDDDRGEPADGGGQQCDRSE